METLNVQTKESFNRDSIINADTDQHVTFLIDRETYGVPVEKVKEIIGMSNITHVPNMVEFMKGVINLRGMVVPVVDMRKKFYLKEREYDATTVIIIVEVKDKLIGMIVDSVSDVLDIPVENIQETPNFSTSIENEFISGIGRVADDMIILLDVDKIMTIEELEKIDHEKLAKHISA